MTSRDKLIEKIESNPIRTDVTLKEVSKYLGFFGFEKARCKGSHAQFVHPSGKAITIVTNKSTIKPAYIRDAVRLVKGL
ncbi:MAG: type II toxin-antitoxin system HicA family toxin [Erysipelothrix sp.]